MEGRGSQGPLHRGVQVPDRSSKGVRLAQCSVAEPLRAGAPRPLPLDQCPLRQDQPCRPTPVQERQARPRHGPVDEERLFGVGYRARLRGRPSGGGRGRSSHRATSGVVETAAVGPDVGDDLPRPRRALVVEIRRRSRRGRRPPPPRRSSYQSRYGPEGSSPPRNPVSTSRTQGMPEKKPKHSLEANATWLPSVRGRTTGPRPRYMWRR